MARGVAEWHPGFVALQQRRARCGALPDLPPVLLVLCTAWRHPGVGGQRETICRMAFLGRQQFALQIAAKMGRSVSSVLGGGLAGSTVE